MRKPIVLSGLAVTAAAGALAVPALASTKSVAVKNFAFKPTSLTVKKGTTVKWNFGDSAKHNVTVERGPVKFHSKDLAKGKSYSHKFSKAGTYKIVCTIHANMIETVKVK